MEAADQIGDVWLGDRNPPEIELVKTRRSIVVCVNDIDVVRGQSTLRGKYDGKEHRNTTIRGLDLTSSVTRRVSCIYLLVLVGVVLTTATIVYADASVAKRVT